MSFFLRHRFKLYPLLIQIFKKTKKHAGLLCPVYFTNISHLTKNISPTLNKNISPSFQHLSHSVTPDISPLTHSLTHSRLPQNLLRLSLPPHLSRVCLTSLSHLSVYNSVQFQLGVQLNPKLDEFSINQAPASRMPNFLTMLYLFRLGFVYL